MKAENIAISCDSGMCNRLEKLFTFLPRAREMGKGIIMRWRKNEECTGHFMDVFDGVEDVQFTEHDLLNCINGWKPHPKFSTLSGWRFGELRSNESLARKINDIYDWRLPAVAVHARRTDINSVAARCGRSITSSEAFFMHLDTWFPEHPIFLAADNRATQQLFRKRYGDRLLTHSVIEDVNRLRRTTFEIAAADLMTCVAASDFVGCGALSSFSRVIADFHRFLSHSERMEAAIRSNK